MIQKACEALTVSANITISCYQGTLVQTKKPTWNIIINHTPDLLDFTIFYTSVLFLFQDPTLHIVIMAPKVPLVCNSFSNLPCFL